MTLADKIVVLRDGRVEQVGSPMELYNKPANKFVAGFLGSPAMNFLPASLLTAGDTRVMGLRPEYIYLDESGPLLAKVQHVEQLGGDTNVIATVGDGDEHLVTVRLFGQHAVERDQTLQLGFDRNNLHYFDE